MLEGWVAGGGDLEPRVVVFFGVYERLGSGGIAEAAALALAGF